jgi:hypothetical protein
MNIVSAGNTFQVYGEDVKTYRQLPVDTYEVCFSKMVGFFLTRNHDLEVNEKVYGNSQEKVNKVLNTFNKLDRNMGVILSGPKGVGKSMFARLLAIEGYENKLPLLIVRNPYPDISSFISSIDQECIILFDEFEKTFKANEESGWNPQEELLSLFDGLDGGKKLFVITCNEVRDLNSYLLNRPGRFHYHFIMTTPIGEEVREYMEDHLEGDALQYVDRVVALSAVSGFTYDILRAIAFELNNGYDLTETMMDLNIERERYVHLDMMITFENGLIATSNDLDLDMFNNRYNYYWCNFEKGAIPKEFATFCNHVSARFYTRDITIDEKGYHLSPEAITLVWDEDWEYLDDDTAEQKLKKARIKEFMDSFKITEVSLAKARPTYGNAAFVNKFLV